MSDDYGEAWLRKRRNLRLRMRLAWRVLRGDGVFTGFRVTGGAGFTITGGPGVIEPLNKGRSCYIEGNAFYPMSPVTALRDDAE